MKDQQRQILFLFIFLCSFLSGVTGQTAHRSSTDLNLSDNYTEEATLITDRNIYITGEKIWFSVLLHCQGDAEKKCLSNVLYVDLYDESAPHLLQQKFRINNGKVSGALIIPSDFITGNYYMRAYTNYQKSSLSVDLTWRELLIINPELKMNVPTEEKTVQLFFSSGGPLYNIPGTGVVTVNGKSVRDVVLLANQRDTVCFVKQIKKNLGIFEFSPEEDKKYGVGIHFTSNDSMYVPIDNIRKSGWEVTTNLQDRFAGITITPVNQNAAIPCELIIKDKQMNVLFRKELPAFNKPFDLEVARKFISSGTNYLILKDLHGKLLSMKILKGQPEEPVSIGIHADSYQYHPGEKVTLSIDGLSDDFTDKANVVVSVAIKGSNADEGNDSLTSEISQAMSLIRENEIIRDKYMTDKLLADHSLSIEDLPDIRDVSLTGLVADSSTGKPVANTEVYLAVLGKEPQLHIYNTNDDGSFIFSINNFHGNKKIYTGTSGLNSINIKINNDFASQFHPAWNSLFFTEKNSALYDKLYINQQVAARFLHDTARLRPTRYLPQPVFSEPDYTVVLDDFIPLSSLQEDFKEIVPNVVLNERKGEYHFLVKTPEPSRLLEDPLVLLDNVPVFNYKELLKIPPLSIEKINIINQEYLLGNHLLNGVINLISKKNSLEGYKFPSGTVFFNYQTITPATEFEVPEMVTTRTKPHSLPYFANLLYWNPDITLTDQPVRLIFTTGDNKAIYKIQVKGITSDGRFVFGSATIDVR